MSRAQWGHGYHNGKNDSQTDTMVGLYLHTRLPDGKINNQGEIIRQLKNGKFVVQLYSFLDGCPTICKVLSEDEIESCTLYASDQDMRKAWEKERLQGKLTERREEYEQGIVDGSVKSRFMMIEQFCATPQGHK